MNKTFQSIRQAIADNKQVIIDMMKAKGIRTISFVSGYSDDDADDMDEEAWLDAINEDEDLLIANQLPSVLVENYGTSSQGQVLAVTLCKDDILTFYCFLDDDAEVRCFEDNEFAWETGWYLYEDIEHKLNS